MRLTGLCACACRIRRRVVCLPDGMYLAAPPSLAAQSLPSGEPVVRWEFGGPLNSVPGAVQRVSIEYDARTGAFLQMARDVFEA